VVKRIRGGPPRYLLKLITKGETANRVETNECRWHETGKLPKKIVIHAQRERHMPASRGGKEREKKLESSRIGALFDCEELLHRGKV